MRTSQVLTGATCFYAFYDVYVELLRAGTSGGSHVTRRHLVNPSATTIAILVVTSLGVTSTTTLTSPCPRFNWTSGAPLAESFDVADMPWIKYCLSGLAIVALLPAAILQVSLLPIKRKLKSTKTLQREISANAYRHVVWDFPKVTFSC